MTKIASFDIFDTTLMRKCGDAGNIFHILAYSLFSDDEQMQDAFYTWRIKAERSCIGKGITNPCIDDIYETCPFPSPTDIMSKEKDIESKNLTVNKHILDLIVKRRSEGYTVMFISDMYLDSEFLHSILKREGCINNDETVFVSCEHNARKDTGKLFNIVRERFAPEEWIHYGDNIISDYHVAKKAKIKAVLYKSHQTSSAEYNIRRLGHNTKEKWKFDTIAGLLHCLNTTSTGMSPIQKIAVNYVAPAYVAYATWIIRQARRRGIKRLYFLSRDSYILKEITTNMKVADIESRFIFVSRKSLLPAFLHISDKESFLSILDCNTAKGKDTEYLLSLFNTSTKEMKEVYGIDIPSKRINTTKEENDLIDKIYETDFIKDFRRNTVDDYNMVMDYFRQEGMIDNTKSAMIDVGWFGTTRAMINTLLRHAGHTDIPFFYYGVRTDVLSPEYGDYFSFTGSPNAGTMNAVHLLEQYFSAAPYPSTVAYVCKKGIIRPKFKTTSKSTNRIIAAENVNGCQLLTKDILYFDMLTDEQLFLLAQASSETLLYAKDTTIDYSPLTMAEPTDELPFVIRYNAKQAVAYLIKGEIVSALDNVSATITFGKTLRRPLILMHRISHAINVRTSKILKAIK